MESLPGAYEFSYFQIFFISIFYSIVGLFLFIAIVLMIRNYMQGQMFSGDVRIDDKVAVITGANTGIGKETAIDLAKRGGKVYIACRDVTRGEEALADIKRESGSDQVYFLQLDLASMESIREFAKKFHQLESKLHILINNAGIMACPQAKTKDGFELQLGTNHLGHFLLTNLLLDQIKAAAPSRIVVVSSLAHILGRIRKEDLNCEKFYNRWLAYGQSKLANILFANELARRLKGTKVVVNSLHPGIVHSNLQRHVNIVLRVISSPIQWIFWKETLAGAQTQIRLAVDPKLDETTGEYFSDCNKTWTMWTAKNEEVARWLWSKSEELTGLEPTNDKKY